MANSIFAAKALVGGGAGSLDDISHATLLDGDICLVTIPTSKFLYVYTFDIDEATAANNSPDLIKPTSVGAGVGSWLLSYMQSFDSFFRDSAKATSLDEFYTGLGLKYDHMWIGAGAWTATSTDGGAFNSEELATNDINLAYYSFDDTTQESIEFDIVMPPTWDRGTVKVKFHWMPTSGATSTQVCIWAMQGGSFSDGDEMDIALGTAVTVNDVVQAGLDGQLHISSATGAMTIAGSPALEDMIHLKIYRDADDGSDTCVGDAKLFGVTIEFANTNTVSAW